MKFCKMCGESKINFEGKQDGLKVKVSTFMVGLHWFFENNKGEKLSIICHLGSYGKENGLFEIMPPKAPEDWNDAVKGYLTFGEVQEWINKLKESEKEE